MDERFGVDAPAVVRDLDPDLVARLARGDAKHADGTLVAALLRRLDAVIDRVADDVAQRIADHLDHLAIELDIAAIHLEPHLLAKIGAQIANHARQRREQAVDALHAGARDRVANLGDAGRDAFKCGLDRDVALGVAKPAAELVAGQHGIGDAAHHPVEQVDRQADRAHVLAAGVGGRLHGRLGFRRGARLDRGLGEIRDQLLVVLARQRLARFQRVDEFADAIDHRQHGTHQPRIRDPPAGANLGERVLGGMA